MALIDSSIEKTERKEDVFPWPSSSSESGKSIEQASCNCAAVTGRHDEPQAAPPLLARETMQPGAIQTPVAVRTGLLCPEASGLVV